jgi:hypothetical protein
MQGPIIKHQWFQGREKPTRWQDYQQDWHKSTLFYTDVKDYTHFSTMQNHYKAISNQFTTGFQEGIMTTYSLSNI